MAGRRRAWYLRRPKISTSAAVVKPPAASATPQATSMAIQMPQGWESLRLVTGPRPVSKRARPKAQPTRATATSSRVPGVKNGLAAGACASAMVHFPPGSGQDGASTLGGCLRFRRPVHHINPASPAYTAVGMAA